MPPPQLSSEGTVFVKNAAGNLQTVAKVVDSKVERTDADSQVFSGSLIGVQVKTKVEQVGINQVVSVEFHLVGLLVN